MDTQNISNSTDWFTGLGDCWEYGKSLASDGKTYVVSTASQLYSEPVQTLTSMGDLLTIDTAKSFFSQIPAYAPAITGVFGTILLLDGYKNYSHTVGNKPSSITAQKVLGAIEMIAGFTSIGYTIYCASPFCPNTLYDTCRENNDILQKDIEKLQDFASRCKAHEIYGSTCYDANVKLQHQLNQTSNHWKNEFEKYEIWRETHECYELVRNPTSQATASTPVS